MKTIGRICMLALALTWPLGAGVSRAQDAPYRINDDQVKDVLVRLERSADSFRKSLREALDHSRFDDTRAEDRINGYVRDFEGSTDLLRKHFDERHPAAADAEAVLQRAASIDAFMQEHPLTPRAQDDWASIRQSLDDLATAYSVTWDWTGRPTAERATDKDVESLLSRITTDADRFRKSLDRALDHSHFDGTRREDDVNTFVKDFDKATERWKSNFGHHDTASANAEEVLRQARFIDGFMGRHELSPEAQSDWATLRADLDELAHAYNVTWSW